MTETHERRTPWYRYQYQQRWRGGVVGGIGPLTWWIAFKLLDESDGSRDVGAWAWSIAIAIALTVLVAVVLAYTDGPPFRN